MKPSSWSDGRPRPLSVGIPQRPSTGGGARLSTGFVRWLKFNLVGAIGIAVQLAALAIFRSLLHLNYLLATTVAVEIAVLHNFLWHERFTWTDRPSGRFTSSLARLARFNLANGAVSILGNLTLMWLLVGQMRLNYFAANLVAIAACSLLNFLLSDRLVFDRNTQACDPG
jgi:putative flippase GtrA